MNCFISRITIVAAISVFCNTIVAMSSTKIYIENHYGAPIKLKTGNAQSTDPEVSVANQQQVLAGTYFNISALSIRTTGVGSRFLSYFTELTPQLNQITRDRSKNAGKDAIIIIKPSKGYQNWDIEVRWQKPDSAIQVLEEEEIEPHKAPEQDVVITTNKSLEQQNKEAAEQAKIARHARFGSVSTAPQDTSLIENKLNNILNGSFGQNYAQKVRAINDYDYTKATSKGMQNLRTHLLKRIAETLEQTYEIESRRTESWKAPDLATDTELKENIDMLYRSLQRYKSMGY